MPTYLGKPCKFLQGPGTTQASRAEVRRLLEAKSEGFVSLVNYTKQGKEFDNGLYIRPLHSNGQCQFFLGSQLDLRGLMNLGNFGRRVSFCEEPDEVFTFEKDHCNAVNDLRVIQCKTIQYRFNWFEK